MKHITYNIVRIAFIVLLCVTCYMLHVTCIRAQSPSSILSISPVIYNIPLSPGKTYSYELKLTNNLDFPLPLSLKVEPLDSTLDSIVKWVTIKDNDMILEAKQKRTIVFDITVPKKVPLGGYYGMMYVSPILPKTAGFPPEVSAKLGVLLMGSVGVQEIPQNKTEIIGFGFDKLFYEQDTVTASFQVKNTALNHFSAKPYLKIKPLFGHEQIIELEEKFVFPGKSRLWKKEFTLFQYPNILYSATLYVSVGNGIQKTASGYFFAFPFIKLILMIIALTLGIFMVRKRKRLTKAIQILVKG